MSNLALFLIDLAFGAGWYFVLASDSAPRWAALGFAITIFYLLRIRNGQNG